MPFGGIDERIDTILTIRTILTVFLPKLQHKVVGHSAFQYGVHIHLVKEDFQLHRLINRVAMPYLCGLLKVYPGHDDTLSKRGERNSTKE